MARDRYLARFRADPSKLRVRVGRHDDHWGIYWRASIEAPKTGHMVSAGGTTAIRAIVRTFQLAEEAGVEGIDRHMGWAYDHPQGALAPPERVTHYVEPEERSTDR